MGSSYPISSPVRRQIGRSVGVSLGLSEFPKTCSYWTTCLLLNLDHIEVENDTAGVAMFILSFLFHLFSELLPSSPPQVSEPWEEIMKDVEDKIMVGMTHWQHPRFHAYFPAGNSYPRYRVSHFQYAISFLYVNLSSTKMKHAYETISIMD